jgi:predicted ATP-grasp superfamily ATP-dependent carboligase
VTRSVLIVEDGLSSFLLPAVRSLGTAGWTVGLAGPRPSRTAGSRWVSRTHVVPPAEQGLEPFAAAVRAACLEGGYSLVFGGDDVEVLALSAARDQIPAGVPYAPHEHVLRAIDKLELTRAAEAAGLTTPATEAATPEAVQRASLPVFAKARLHWAPGTAGNRGRLAAVHCATRADLVAAVADMEASGASVALQAPVSGDLMAVTVLCDADSAMIARSQQVATRLSPYFRTSTRAVTVSPDPQLLAQVQVLLADLRWTGIANLQFLRPPGGAPHLIDLNGRFYGSLALAIEAGLDLPAWWADLATGRTPPSGVVGRPGRRYQALEEDLRRARAERRGGLARDLAGTVLTAARSTHSTWDRRDLRPAVARALHLLGQQRRR